MAEAVVSMVMERIGNLLIEEARLIHGLRDQVQDIHDELRWMQSFLKDADARQHEDERVRTWVREIKEIAYDAGDVLESFVLGVESRRGGSILNVLRRYACIVNEVITCHKVRSKILAILVRISKLTDRLQRFGIRSLSEDRESSSFVNQRQSQLRRSYSHVDEDDFVGLEEDVNKLVEYLLNEDQAGDHQVVAICGMGGLGKTTLAKKIYHHERVKSHFDALAWVCISQQWQLTTILQQILVKLIPSKKHQIHKERDDGQLMSQIFDVQREKKCLVVLDDIWSEDTWYSITDAFPKNTTKSKLLLTSRNINVVKHVNPKVLVHKPEPLKEDECLELLKKKAFTMRDDDPDVKKKEELASEMIGECGGLPLAVIVLGGILATKQCLSEWERVRQSIKSYLRRGEGMGQHESGVSKILGLSYNDLPYQLKPCFLYLGKFKEDMEIEAERLYQLWMAESMILSEDRREGETMMDVAECYLNELAQRCMVQVQKKAENRSIKIKSCRLHDLMRDLCLLKAKEEDFFNTVDFQCVNNSELVESSSSFTTKSRRVVIYFHHGNTNSRSFSVDQETSQRLWSLLFFTSWEYGECSMPRMVKSQLNDFKMLRVLAIEGLFLMFLKDYRIKQWANFILDHLALSKAVGNLIHLRYLSLRASVFFMIPSSINNLKHLQTLDLRGMFLFYHECSANVLRKMRRLKHLYLPTHILKRQLFKPTKLQLGSLNNLETLEIFYPSCCDSKGLCKLINLRKLKAVLNDVDLEEVEPIIDYLSSTAAKHMRYSDLYIWSVNFDSAKGHTTLIKILSCCHLHTLKIVNDVCKKLPGYEEVPNLSQSLTTLTLYNFYLKEDPMPTLEKLPNLMNLTLDNGFSGRTMVCSDEGFPQLRSLKLKFLVYIDNWTVEEGAMPKLSQLKIVCCRSLKTVPDGLRFITTLRELAIKYMGEEFERRVKVVDGEEGQDFHKIRHVTSITICPFSVPA